MASTGSNVQAPGLVRDASPRDQFWEFSNPKPFAFNPLSTLPTESERLPLSSLSIQAFPHFHGVNFIKINFRGPSLFQSI